LLLVSKPKGIYKPSDLPYALSIRINLDSPYADGVAVPTPGGGWLLSYHQENAEPADRDKIFSNRGFDAMHRRPGSCGSAPRADTRWPP
jgi:hypothetical protein